MNATKTRVLHGMALLAISCSLLSAQWVDITNNTFYTVEAGGTIVYNVSIKPYFDANGIAWPANGPFPDTMQMFASGADPGQCVYSSWGGQNVCSNYRFTCYAQVAATRDHLAAKVLLHDVYAASIGESEGTCYPIAYQNGSWHSVTLMPELSVRRTATGAPDSLLTSGWISVLTNGTDGIDGTGSVRLVVQFNPKPGDPTSFQFGKPQVGLRTQIGANNLKNLATYPLGVAANTIRIYGSSSATPVAPAVLTAPAALLTGFTDISNQSSYTIQPGGTLLFKISLASYFATNGITTGEPFPEFATSSAYGPDNGTCSLYPSFPWVICSNFKFHCTAVSATNTDSSPLAFNLADPGALNSGDTDPDACYVLPFITASGGHYYLMQPAFAGQNNALVAGMLKVLADGSNGTIAGGATVNVMFRYDPPGEGALPFTFGFGTAPLTSVFRVTGLASNAYPFPVSARTVAVYAKP